MSSVSLSCQALQSLVDYDEDSDEEINSDESNGDSNDTIEASPSSEKRQKLT